MTNLPLLLTEKSNNYDTILVVNDYLINLVYYKCVKIIVDVINLAKVFINMVIKYYGLPKSIISDQGSLFTLKFLSSLYYLLGIK